MHTPTLTQRELGRVGYRGHAFACEEGTTGEVMGAVLTRPGVVRCYVAGAYAGEGCYTLDVCGYAETLCFD